MERIGYGKYLRAAWNRCFLGILPFVAEVGTGKLKPGFAICLEMGGLT